MWPRGRGIGLLVCKRRFSFHEFYNFSYLLYFFFFRKLFYLPTTFTHTHDTHQRPHPRPTTHDLYPLPMIFSYTRCWQLYGCLTGWNISHIHYATQHVWANNNTKPTYRNNSTYWLTLGLVKIYYCQLSYLKEDYLPAVYIYFKPFLALYWCKELRAVFTYPTPTVEMLLVSWI